MTISLPLIKRECNITYCGAWTMVPRSFKWTVKVRLGEEMKFVKKFVGGKFSKGWKGGKLELFIKAKQLVQTATLLFQLVV